MLFHFKCYADIDHYMIKITNWQEQKDDCEKLMYHDYLRYVMDIKIRNQIAGFN